MERIKYVQRNKQMQMMFNTLLEVIKMQIEFYIWKAAKVNTGEKNENTERKKTRQNSHKQ